MTQYWIKGDDGEEYGPVSLQELAEWVRENRAGLDTLVRKEGSPDDWQPWQKHPELMTLMAELSAGSLFPGQPGLALAPIGPRMLAYVLDVFAVSLVVGLIDTFLPATMQVDSREMFHHITEGKTMTPHEIGFMLLTLGFYIAYFTYFHGSTGQTPGKRLFGVRVVDAHGLTISYWRALIRAIASLFSQFPYYAGFFLVFVTPHRRTLHDLVARTYVVRK